MLTVQHMNNNFVVKQTSVKKDKKTAKDGKWHERSQANNFKSQPGSVSVTFLFLFKTKLHETEYTFSDTQS